MAYEPPPKVVIYGVRDRRKSRPTANPFLLDWRVEGRQRTRAFPTKLAAEQFRSELYAALLAHERFDPVTGLPVSWERPVTPRLHAWCRSWLAAEWVTWSPRTRVAAVEALAYVVPAALHPAAPRLRADEARRLRAYLTATLPPAPKGEPVDAFGDPYEPPRDERFEKFLAEYSPLLTDLDRLLLADAESRLAVRADGTPRGSSFARYVKIAKQCLERAVELELLTANPWPPRPKGHAHRKAVKKANHRSGGAVDVELLPSVAEFTTLADAMVSHQPASRSYRVMCEVMFYAGLRPSEVVDLMVADCRLPAGGFGEIHVRRAAVGIEESGDPKTGPRRVPIPPVLVAALRAHIERTGVTGFLFRTRTGARPASSNWDRILHRACAKTGLRPLAPYDLRHACATNWLNAGVSFGDCANRMGHSVETLQRYYVGVLSGDVDANNARIAAFLDTAATPPPPHLVVVAEDVAGEDVTARRPGDGRRGRSRRVG
jgi:integrase